MITEVIKVQLKFMTVNEVADFLNVSRRSVYRMVKEKQIPTVKVCGRVRFRSDEIDAYFRSDNLQSSMKTDASAG